MKSLISAARLLPFLAFCLLGVSSTCMAQQKTGATFQAPGATLYYEVFGSRKGTPLVVVKEPEEFVRAMEQFLSEPRAISAQNRHKPSAPVLGPVKTIEVNGVQLAYVERGRGEPVVLIHPGFLHDYRTWSTQLPAFSRRYRVIAYSMRYRWPNTPSGDGSDLSPSVNAADLVGLIEGLKLGRVHLVGHSGSAGLALRMARDRPDLVRSLVLGEPGAQAFAAGNLEARPLYSPELINDVRQAFERGDIEAAVQMVRETVLGKERAADPGPAWVRRMLLDNAWQLKQLWTRGKPLPPVTCEEARRIKLPTLLLGGDRSPGIFRLVLDELQKCLPASERGVLPESSHGLELENPAAFNKIVLGFLTRNSRPARR